MLERILNKLGYFKLPPKESIQIMVNRESGAVFSAGGVLVRKKGGMVMLELIIINGRLAK